MAFDTKVEGVTEDTQSILNDFFSCYTEPITYRNLIRKLPSKIGISDFRSLTYKEFEILKGEYKSNKTNRTCIESLFKYLYLIDALNEKQKFAELFGDKEKIKKQFEHTPNKVTKQSKVKKEVEKLLSFEQIEKLLAYCDEVEPATDFSSYKRLRMAFAFYVLFFHEISVNGLKNINMWSYSEGTVMIEGKLIDVPEKYQSMFLFAKENGKPGKYQYLGEDIENLGKLVGIDKLVPKEITMTSKRYQFNCPICGKQYFSFGENWTLINGKIVCSLCAKQLIEKDLKKNVISELATKKIELVTSEEKQKIVHYISSYDKLKKKLKVPCDFDEWNKYIKLIGDLGEKYVYEREIKKLVEAKREDLAECINADIAKDHTNGYDILSYTETGEEIYIEVKSTPGRLDVPFYISKNEWDKANECKEKGKLYELHRVYNVGKDDIEVKIYRDIQLMRREDVLYKVFVEIGE
mgnify:CR=1 FL=1